MIRLLIILAFFISYPLYSRSFEEIRSAKASTLRNMMVFHHLADSVEQHPGILFELAPSSRPFRPGQSDQLADNAIELMPQFVQSVVGTYAIEDGPNCWNTALNFHNPEIGIHHTTMGEMIGVLSEHYYPVDLRHNNHLQLGDIISLWRPDIETPRELLHSAVYLGNGITFQKHSWEKNSPYVFSTLESAFDLYDLDTGWEDEKSMYKYTVHRHLDYYPQ